ncbi:MAG: tetratricopeptide repeat protein, partial [Vicinamibacterales bacterium]|nr:tetratricopeptide repeat protein [Vicinamibacterales bacterium]
IAPLEQALSEDPDNIEVLQTLGQAYAAVGRIDDAARVLSDALAAIPDGSQFFRHLVAPWTRQLELWQEAGGSRN